MPSHYQFPGPKMKERGTESSISNSFENGEAGGSKNTRKLLEENSEEEQASLCIICYDTAKDPVFTKCCHIFCRLCLNQWCDEQPNRESCPICRTAIDADEIWLRYRLEVSEEDHRGQFPPEQEGQIFELGTNMDRRSLARYFRPVLIMLPILLNVSLRFMDSGLRGDSQQNFIYYSTLMDVLICALWIHLVLTSSEEDDLANFVRVLVFITVLMVLNRVTGEMMMIHYVKDDLPIPRVIVGLTLMNLSVWVFQAILLVVYQIFSHLNLDAIRLLPWNPCTVLYVMFFWSLACYSAIWLQLKLHS